MKEEAVDVLLVGYFCFEEIPKLSRSETISIYTLKLH